MTYQRKENVAIWLDQWCSYILLDDVARHRACTTYSAMPKCGDIRPRHPFMPSRSIAIDKALALMPQQLSSALIIFHLSSANFKAKAAAAGVSTSTFHSHLVQAHQALVALLDAAAATNKKTDAEITLGTSKPKSIYASKDPALFLEARAQNQVNRS